MSEFDFSTLITDRTNADVSALSALLSKKLESWTPEEVEKFNNGQLKGGYWWTDLNRVTACMEYINRELQELGYETGYKPVVVHEQPEPEEHLLPDGYTQLEYIESTGNQWIDTGIVPDQNTRIKCKINTLGISSASNFIAPYGAAVDYKNSAFECYSWNGTLEFNYGNQYKFTSTLPDNYTIEIDHNKNTVTCNGETIAFAQQVFTAPKSLVLFGMHRPSGVTPGKCASFYYEIYSGKDLMRNYIPCKNQSGVAGMYDAIVGTFYESAGSNPFVSGPEIVIEPDPQPEPLDPYTWYKEDSPTLSQMEQYLSNVAALRSVFELQDHAPQTPKSIAFLTFAKANDIESVLKEVENVIILIISSFWYSGELYSGEV